MPQPDEPVSEAHTMSKQHFTVKAGARRLAAVLHLPSGEKPSCVITCHGLFSSKDSEKFISIAEDFSAAGIAVIRFDFSGCGESSGAIADTTVSRRIEELEAVARYAAQTPLLGPSLGLLGSSLGGFVAILYAMQHPCDALSIWSAPLDLAAIRPNIPERDMQILHRDFFVDAGKYHIETDDGKLPPLQIIHGERDEIVPCEHAKKLFSIARVPKRLEILSRADHRISIPQDRMRAISLARKWFESLIL